VFFYYTYFIADMEMRRKRKLDDSNEHTSMLPPKVSPGLLGNLFKGIPEEQSSSNTSSKVCLSLLREVG